MSKAYVIGSLSQEKEIEDFARRKSLSFESIEWVKSEPSKSFDILVKECFDKIDNADVVISILKPNGTFGRGTTYELEYARRMGKDIRIIRL